MNCRVPQLASGVVQSSAGMRGIGSDDCVQVNGTAILLKGLHSRSFHTVKSDPDPLACNHAGMKGVGMLACGIGRPMRKAKEQKPPLFPHWSRESL